jgi:hypothetical protein
MNASKRKKLKQYFESFQTIKKAEIRNIKGKIKIKLDYMQSSTFTINSLDALCDGAIYDAKMKIKFFKELKNGE